MRYGISKTHLLAVLIMGTASVAEGVTISTFDIPGCFGCIESIAGINNSGTVAGTSYYPWHKGFVRSPQGVITSFDAGGVNTFVTGINDSGSTVGYFQTCDSSGCVNKGFVRGSNGYMVLYNIFDRTTNTVFTGINNSGAVLGYTYGTSYFVPSPFLIDTSGYYTYFNVPGGGLATKINASGQVAGNVSDGSGDLFIRNTGGDFVTFAVGQSPVINAFDNSATVGGQVPSSQGFERFTSGAITWITAPNFTTATLTALNSDPGSTRMLNAYRVGYGYLNGVITGFGNYSSTFTRKDIVVSLAGYWTYPRAVNNSGVIAGTFTYPGSGSYTWGFVATGAFQ